LENWVLDVTETDEVRTTFLSQGFLIAGRYEIEKPLGTGGMGTVYLVSDRILGEEKVAIKVLHKQYAYEKKYTQRFLREVQLMRRVNHKNVVRTYDVGADGDIVYFTMEYIDGKSVLDHIEARTFPKNQLINTIVQVCEGLEAIHAAGIIHRDLKPGNIILLEDGSIKITDFGVARPETSDLTAHNEVIGSSPYIAPEVWLGDTITSSIDLYSLGVILYELNTGILPFDAESPALVMRMHLDRKPMPPKELNKTVPVWLNKLILKLLEKSPLDRIKNARDIIDYVASNVDPNANDSYSSGLASYATAPTVSNTFIAKLEELSKKATDQNATSITIKDTKSMLAKVVSWSYRKKPKNKVVSRIFDHLAGLRFAQSIQKILWGILKPFTYILLATGLAAFTLGTLTQIYTQLPPLQSFEYQHFEPTYLYTIRSYYWGAIFQLGIPYTFLLLLALSTPMFLIGALCRSFTACFRPLICCFVFNAVAGLLISLKLFFPMLGEDNVNLASLISIGMAAGRQLSEVALLSPFISTFQVETVGNALTLVPSGVAPLTNDFLLPFISLVYILMIAFFSRVCLEERTERPELMYLLGVVGLIALLLIQPYYFSDQVTGSAIEYTSFELLQHKFQFPRYSLYSSAINWGFIYLSVFIFVPLIGGKKKSY
jgi:serine/threonine protein kinase